MTSFPRRSRPIAGGLSLLLIWAVLAGCSSDRARDESAPAKVAIIGWDGATWSVIEPMLRRGELPNLARLVESGGRGVLVAEPPMYSPVLWTSLSTGFGPREHGITGFQLPDPHGTGSVLAATFHRRRAPLWAMASSAGKQVGFVGWWTTWPAEPVRGYMVSDHLAYNRWDAWARRPDNDTYHLTHPPELADELAAVAVRPDAIDPATLTAIAGFNPAERREMMQATRPIKFHGPSVLRYGYATDASNVAFATHLLETREQPDLFGLVFILTDVAGHVFWHTYEPELYPQDPAAVAHLREAIPNVYKQLDRWTGELLERLDAATHVIIVSDHGMAAKHVLPRPEVNPSGDHIPDGILVVAGPNVAAGADLGRRPAQDFAPTVLALLGLPGADDMPGRPIRAVLSESTLAGRNSIASYGDGQSGRVPDSRSPGEDDLEERLRSLGYIR